MVLENLFKSKFVNKHKSIILFLSIAYSIYGIIGSFFLFNESYSSFVSLSIISLFFIVSLHDVLKIPYENQKIDNNFYSLSQILSNYKPVYVIFFYIFAGVLITFSSFNLFLPSEFSEYLFDLQNIHVISTSIFEIFHGFFMPIFFNNLFVLFICFFTSFFFGIRTIFLLILVWNASVIGVVFSETSKIASQTAEVSFFCLFLIIFFGALPHIFFEITAYLFSGILGETLSVYFLQKHKDKVVVAKFLAFFIGFLGLSVLLLIIGAFLEVHVSNFLIRLFYYDVIV